MPQRYEKEKIQTNNLVKIKRIQRNNSTRIKKIQRNIIDDKTLINTITEIGSESLCG
jgi:hypothetical protein